MSAALKPDDYAGIAGRVVRALLGEPTAALSSPTELRYGTHGSLSIKLATGQWFDHERGEGGGVLDLIVRNGEAQNHAQAVRWIEAQGFASQPANDTAAPAKQQRKAGFNIVARYPYVDADGVLLFEVCRLDPKDFRQRRPDGDGWSWTVKGVRQVPYRLPQMMAAPDAPVFVVEGEKDADALAAAGLIATCNAGGAGKWPKVLTPHFVGRRVFVIPDNDKAGRDHANQVLLALNIGGVKASLLELPGLAHKGDVSDWLASGGTADALVKMVDAVPIAANDNAAADDACPEIQIRNGERARVVDELTPLVHRPRVTVPQNPGRDEERRRQQQEENTRIQEDEIDTAPPDMDVAAMLEDCVWIASGSQVGRISMPKWSLMFSEFAGLTASCVSVEQAEDGKRKAVLNAAVWKRDPRRLTVYTRTFHAGAAAICRDPDGAPALNTWRPIQRWAAKADIKPFLDQVAYLFEDATERGKFLDWLAHIEQRPGELPHYGWLHIAKNTGTGRNWVASVLARVFRGYVAPNVDLPALLDSQFNDEISGRVLAMVDEVQEGGGEGQYRHINRLKSIANAEVRHVNPKFGRKHKEHNACRWLVFSNHDNALPLNDTDRRWRVVRHDAAPRSPEDYERLYALLEDREFINAVGVWLRGRGISGFNPGERPPMNEAKRAAINASKPLMVQAAEELVARWPSDVIANHDVWQVLGDGGDVVKKNTVSAGMRRALEDLGAKGLPGVVRIASGPTRYYALRNIERWETATSDNIKAEINRARGTRFDFNATAMEVLADAQSGVTRYARYSVSN